MSTWLFLEMEVLGKPTVGGLSVEVSRDGTARHILVIDNNVDAANTLTKLLALLGHTVQAAYDGGQSMLELARIHWPEVVLLDLGMPGIDGWAVAQCLRQQRAGERSCS